MSDPDTYPATAPILTEATLRQLSPSYRQSEALALAQAIDPEDLLQAHKASAIKMFGDL